MSEVLVPGGSGFLGRHLVAARLAEGASVIALCREPGALDDLAHPALRVALGDVRDAAGCGRALAGVGAVLHLAAVRNRPGGSPAEMAAVNEEATVRLARQAAEAGVGRFVYVATAHVFGPADVPLDESAEVSPAKAGSYYVSTKARAVLALRRLAAAGAPVVTVCPSIVYGPDHAARPNRVTSQVRRLLRRRVDVVLGGGTAPRDLVHVGDVVAVLLAAARRPGVAGEEILVAGEPVSQRGLGRLVARCAGRRPPVVIPVPRRAARAAARVLDRALGHDPRCGLASAVDTLGQPWCYRSGKAAVRLGHRARPLAEGIAETVAWIRGGQQ